MGGCDFDVVARGPSAKEAFRLAVEQAQYESGHGGYTGTIAEKSGFIMLPPSEAQMAEFVAEVRKSCGAQIRRLRGLPVVSKETWDLYWRAPRGTMERPAEEVAASVESEAAREERIAQVKASMKRDPLRLAALRKWADWATSNHDEVSDKWGPAGCLVLSEPVKGRRRGAVGVMAEVRKRHGQGAKAKLELRRRDHRSFAELLVEEPGVAGWRRYTGEGADASEARGDLFSAAGEYLFFGWASS